MKIDASLQEKINDVSQRHGFEGLILHGSMVNNSELANDIDICYIRKKSLEFRELLNCISDFIDIFNKDKIDIVYWSDASPLLKNEMAHKNQIIFGDKDYVTTFICAGQKMYWDYKKYYDQMKEKMIKEARQ